MAVFLLLIVILCAGLLTSKTPSEHSSQNRSTAGQIQVTPLPSSAVRETAYYTDELGWIQNSAALEKALGKFYRTTGVQPHIYLCENAMGQSEADSLYSRLFTDEGHFLLAIARDWNTAYILGDDAASVLTDAVMDIFWENFDACADSARADEDVLTDTFTYTTDRLFSGTARENGAITESQRRQAGLFLVLAVIIFLAVAVVIIAVIVRSRKNARYDRTMDDGPAAGEPEDSQSRGYTLNGEFHPYEEEQK